MPWEFRGSMSAHAAGTRNPYVLGEIPEGIHVLGETLEGIRVLGEILELGA